MGLCILPSLRLNRLHEEVRRISDPKTAMLVMEAVERHLEQGAHRWGNACALPECGAILTWKNYEGWDCPHHGHLSRTTPTKLLVAFDPITTPQEQP